MKVRNRFRNDGAKKYLEVEGGLNKMTFRRFNRMVKASNLKSVFFRTRAVKELNILTRIPLVKELFTNAITCMLQKPLRN